MYLEKIFILFIGLIYWIDFLAEIWHNFGIFKEFRRILGKFGKKI